MQNISKYTQYSTIHNIFYSFNFEICHVFYTNQPHFIVKCGPRWELTLYFTEGNRPREVRGYDLGLGAGMREPGSLRPAPGLVRQLFFVCLFLKGYIFQGETGKLSSVLHIALKVKMFRFIYFVNRFLFFLKKLSLIDLTLGYGRPKIGFILLFF